VIAPSGPLRSRWFGAWWDALAFAGGLALAWFGKWETADLVWSLWLSSLVVGYALIVWNLSATLREFAVNALRDPSSDARPMKMGTGAMLAVGTLFMLAFFTVHFGGFHFGHSIFLANLFPIVEGGEQGQSGLNWPMYREVVERYWIFLPVAFLAEREAFQKSPPATRDRARTGEAITRRKKNAFNSSLMAPYKNVIRMHLLIFFFAGAHFAQLDNFVVYAVVYAVYFFPWRMLKRDRGEAGPVSP
jgi:hypothetical protein